MKNLIILILSTLTLTVNAQSGSSDFKKVNITKEYKIINENEYSNYKNCNDCVTDTENWTSVNDNGNTSTTKHISAKNNAINNSSNTKPGLFKNDGIVSEEMNKTKRIVWGAISAVVTVSLLTLIGHATQ